MRSGPADPTGATILCSDLSASAATSVALALARWLVGRHGPGAVDVVSLWSGGGWEEAFADLVPVWAVNDLERPDPLEQVEPLDLGRLADRPHRSLRDRLSADALVGAGIDRGARVLRVAGLRRAADGLRGTGLRHRLAASDRPIWVADPGAARLLQYVPAGRRVVAHHGEFDPDPTDVVHDPADLALLLQRPDWWIAGSEEAATRLRRAGVRSPVTVLPDLVDTADRSHAADRAATRQRLASVGIPADVPIVMALGEIDWWDEPDSFVQVAWEAAHRAPGDGAPHWLWVGGRSTERMLWPLRHDISHAGLDGLVHVAPPALRPLDLLAAADVIAITRRGGFHPAQVREIEAIGLPIVRYVAAGEAVGHHDGSIRVPYLDEAALADAVLAALTDTAAGREAREAAGRIRAGHAAEVAGPAVVAVLTGRET